MFEVCISYICVHVTGCLRGLFDSECQKTLVCRRGEGVLLWSLPWLLDLEVEAAAIMEGQETENNLSQGQVESLQRPDLCNPHLSPRGSTAP